MYRKTQKEWLLLSPDFFPQEYLIRLINNNHLDPVDHLELPDVLVIAKRDLLHRGIQIPPKTDKSDDAYKTILVQVRVRIFFIHGFRPIESVTN